MINSDKLCKLMTKLVVFSYIVPSVFIFFVADRADLSLNDTVPYMFAFLGIMTIVNCAIVYKICEKDRQESDIELGPATVKAETPSPEINDDPPSYSEVTKDPPPYSVLRYYKRIMKKTPFVRRNNSLEKSSRKVSDEPSVAPNRPSLKRNQSSPN